MTTDTTVVKYARTQADDDYDKGNKDSRTALLYKNGLRKAWEAKGYGRATARTALDVPQATLWHWELRVVAGTPDHKAAMAAIKALPVYVKPAK